MSHFLISDPTLYSRLLEFDAELAGETLGKGCPHYPRKPRGIPADHRPGFSFRFSFCCSSCRRRVTSPSLRFLGRKIYIGLVVVIDCCCVGRITAWFSRVSDAMGISLRTLWRWRAFWRETFPSTRFWQEARGRLMPIPDDHAFPLSLLQVFEGSREDPPIAFLRFLSPISVGPIVTIREGH